MDEFDLTYRLHTDIKAQVLADFINELTPVVAAEDKEWKLFIDGSSTYTSAGLGVAIMDLAGATIMDDVKLCFVTTNNKAEYAAFLADLRFAKGVCRLSIFIDS